MEKDNKITWYLSEAQGPAVCHLASLTSRAVAHGFTGFNATRAVANGFTGVTGTKPVAHRFTGDYTSAVRRRLHNTFRACAVG